MSNEGYERLTNLLAGYFVLARLWVPRRAFHQVLHRKAHGFTNYADHEARGILIA
ncbi:hypothetical protein [Candidatus Poriferisodalis sp.]|uniref:hypothetical protein n=1 Tax=Candidatus Poriferisodalis sp. TaxID=3101277 RepID=UPI003D14DB2B